MKSFRNVGDKTNHVNASAAYLAFSGNVMYTCLVWYRERGLIKKATVRVLRHNINSGKRCFLTALTEQDSHVSVENIFLKCIRIGGFKCNCSCNCCKFGDMVSRYFLCYFADHKIAHFTRFLLVLITQMHLRLNRVILFVFRIQVCTGDSCGPDWFPGVPGCGAVSTQRSDYNGHWTE